MYDSFRIPSLIIAGSNNLKATSATNPQAVITSAGDIGMVNYDVNAASSLYLKIISLANASTANLARKFKVYQYANVPEIGQTIKSILIQSDKIDKIIKKAYTAPTAQVSYIGYDGSSAASVSYECDKLYSFGLRIETPEVNQFFGNAGLIYPFAVNTGCCDSCTNGCDTVNCYEVDEKFVVQFNADTTMQRYVYAELILDNSANDTATGLADGTGTFVKDSKTVTFSVNQTIASGAYLRIGGGNPPTDVDPVYKVATGVTAGTTITLETPWQEATATKTIDSTLADSDVAVVTIAGVTKCGIKLTGKFINLTQQCSCQPIWGKDVRGVKFVLTPGEGFDCTLDSTGDGTFGGLFTYTTSMTYGNGSGQEVAWYLENWAIGFYQERDFMGYDSRFNQLTKRFASDALTYDIFEIFHRTPQFETEVIEGERTELRTAIIAVETTSVGTPGSTTTTNLGTFFTNLASAWPNIIYATSGY